LRLIMPLNVKMDSEKLALVDPDIASLIDKIGIPPQRRREKGFSTLIHILISQQISLQAADAIWSKLKATSVISPEAVFFNINYDGLRKIGFSHSKANWSIQLSKKILTGEFNTDLLDRADDTNAMKYLMTLAGFGEWSSSIYLIFCLERSNIWPAGDIALQETIRQIKKLSARPNTKEMKEISTIWQPYRSSASHLLWHYYAKIIKHKML
jgi:DNA-3-methyladenine glycosylase II